jgi:DNA-binding MarR family transcriptional regulator
MYTNYMGFAVQSMGQLPHLSGVPGARVALWFQGCAAVVTHLVGQPCGDAILASGPGRPQVVFSYRKKYTESVAKATAGNDEFVDPEEWESWAALLSLHRTVLQDLDAELRQQHKLAISEFDVLIALFNAPDNRLGMSALAREAMLSPAGITHLVTRLERDGLVKREVDPADRRKWFTVLTEQGDRALRAARRTHNTVLRRTFLAATSSADRKLLRQLSQRLSYPDSGAIQN